MHVRYVIQRDKDVTAYIVREGAQKKKGILEKREKELCHHIRHQSSAEKIVKAAEKVRYAHKAVIKCLLHETEAVKPEDEERFNARWRHIEEDQDYWDAVTTESIIERYTKNQEQDGLKRCSMPHRVAVSES